jgi:NAD(P)-dependent dehydrogenase (short-subunit alcohol dehydrogenase family)
MAVTDVFDFGGRRALVVGGATGMGGSAAALLAQLGADVIVMDYAPVTLPGAEVIKIDLRDKAQIDAAVDACAGPIHILMSCAGVAPGAPGIERVNFLGQRHLIERMIDEEKLPEGSAIAMISSIAGYGWEAEVPTLLDFLDTPDFESGLKWMEAHPDKAAKGMDYVWTKQAVCAYVGRAAFPLRKRGIRINAVLPGVIDTPLGRASGWVEDWNHWWKAVETPPTPPEEISYPLAFLCSKAASHVNGTMLIVDGGFVNAGITQVYQNRFATRGSR